MLAQADSMFGVSSCDFWDDPSLTARFSDLVLGIVVPVSIQEGIGYASYGATRPLDEWIGIDQKHGGLGIGNIRAGMA